MWLTPAINATMKASWSGMTLTKWLDGADGHANKGDGCVDSPQDDMYMNFSGDLVTQQVQTAATKKWNTITVGFCACNASGDYESSQDRWKKFRPTYAKLVVEYDSKPGKPIKLQVAKVDCPSDGVRIGTTAPTFSAVYPDADSGQTLTGTYEWIEVPSGGMEAVTDTFPARKTPPAPASASANGRGTTTAVAVVNAKNYAFRVTSVDPSPYRLWSGWSAWCTFSVDTAQPPPPEITPPTFPADGGPGPGKPITFTVSTEPTDPNDPNDPARDVAKFRYSFTGPPATLYGLRAYPGDGAGGFSATYSEPASAWYTDGTVLGPGDLSGDGKPDVVFRRQETSELYYAKGDGAGGFQGGATLLDGGNWSSAQYLFSPGDFTGDGVPDLLYRDAATQNLWMRAGAAGGGLQATSVQIGTGWSSANWIFSPGDYSGDGKPDVLWRKTDGGLYLVRGNGTGGWITGISENIGAGWGGAALFGRGDFTGDGKSDILGRINATGEVRLYPGTGGWLSTTGITKGTIPIGGGVFSPGDFTGDSKPDVLAAVAAPPSFGEVDASPDEANPNRKTAQVTVLAYKYGKNIFWARSIDSTGNLGNSNSAEVEVGKPSGPVAKWRLETDPDPTHDQAAALRDGEPTLPAGSGTLAADTPLSTANISWDADARFLGGATAAMVGSGKQAQTSGPVVDTTKSFSVAAWVHVTDAGTTCCKTVVSQDGAVTNGFNLYYVPSTKQWGFSMYDADNTSTQGAFVFAPAQPSVWTHLAAVYDASQKQMRLYVNGDLAGTASHDSTWNASGPLHIGYAKWGAGQSNTGAGQIADVQVFDRFLVDHDFTGQFATDPDASSGGLNEPGILAPTAVGRWEFENAHPCVFADRKDTCDAKDSTPFDRWLALSLGSDIAQGNHGMGLQLDNRYFPEEDPTNTDPTWEAGRSANISGVLTDSDGNETTVWADTPVLRTDQSFTVGAWARVDRTDATQTILAQDGQQNSGLLLQYVPGATSSEAGSWKFSVPATSDAVAADTTSITAPAPDPNASWHHVVGVLDVPNRELRLYVDGALANSSEMNSAWVPWQASGPLTVGRSLANGQPATWLFGGVDDISVFQGALTPVQVDTLHHDQAVAPVQP